MFGSLSKSTNIAQSPMRTDNRRAPINWKSRATHDSIYKCNQTEIKFAEGDMF